MELRTEKGFNLNLLECKFFKISKRLFWRRVLISTYWNVNATNPSKSYFICTVLISTYWNVNRVGDVHWQQKNISFNLNLLECKFGCTLEVVSQIIYVLISTYWNVNIENIKNIMKVMSFNLNLLECKYRNQVWNIDRVSF